MTRLDQKKIRVDPRVSEGYYSDAYFNRTKEVLEKDNHNPVLRMQVFQKNHACVCGIDESIAILKHALGEEFSELTVKALHDGDLVEPFETVMTIEGPYQLFAHLETVYLGALARRTKIATNVYKTVKEATKVTDKPVLFFPARFDIYQAQAGDGYAYDVAVRALDKRGSAGVSTHAQGEWWGSKGIGTMPHAMIAAYNGDTAKATLKFAEHIDPNIKRVSLVDFSNDCVKTSLEVADAMLAKYLETGDERFKLFGVRLDTSGSMIDKSLEHKIGEYGTSPKEITGVTPELVMNVYLALQERVRDFPEESVENAFYNDINIIVSGGFTPEKIRLFEDLELPVSAYGVGSSMFKGNFDFTADIVQRNVDGEWQHNAKVGRQYKENPRLEVVE